MTGYIYIITNDINNKVYIGQTKTTIEQRWRKHIDNSRNNPNKQVITSAIHKYGKEHFKIKKIAEVPIEDLDFFEVFYIKKYNSFQNGYNMTTGGCNNSNGPTAEQISLVIELSQTTKTNYKQIGKKVGLSDKTVKNILNKYNLDILERTTENKGNIKNLEPYFGKHIENLIGPCPVKIIELDKDFKSLLECADYLIKNNYTKTPNRINVMKSISRALSNKDYQRKTYLGFHLEKK